MGIGYHRAVIDDQTANNLIADLTNGFRQCPSRKRRSGTLNPAGSHKQGYFAVMVISVFRRRLREGKTFEDFLEAWQAERGFGVPTRVFNAVSLEDEREILTVAFVQVATETFAEAARSVAEQEAVRHNRIDEVIESTELRAFYDLRCEHDLSSQPREVSLGSGESLLAALAVPSP